MKKIILFAFAIFTTFAAAAQYDSLKSAATAQYDSLKSEQSVSGYGFSWANGIFRSSFKPPQDTIKLAMRDSGKVALKNGSWYQWNGYVWASAAGGSGTVGSVGLAMPSGFYVANSPVTTTGTLTVTGAGKRTQIINGVGELTSIPFSTNSYNTYTVPFASSSFTDSTLVAQYTGGGVTNYFNNGLWLNGTYTGSIDNSRLVAWNYGHIVLDEFSQRLVFQVGDSSADLKIGIGVKSNTTISPSINQTNYIDATVGGSGSLINTCNGQTVTSTGLTVNYGDFVELQAIQQADSVTVYFRNMTTGISVNAKRKVDFTTLSEYVSLVGYPTIYFAKGNVRLISYSVSKPDFDFAILGNSITAGYRNGRFDSSFVAQLKTYTPAKINNMARAAAVTADYLQVKDNFNFYNKNVIVSGLFGNDPYSAISDAQIKANYATIIARLRAKGNKITHVDNPYRGAFLGSGGWAQLNALNLWIDTAYGGIDTIVHVNALLNTGTDYAAGDPTHPNLLGNTKIANKILADAPNLFPLLTAANATVVDTTNYKPTVKDTSGREFKVSWNNFGSSGGGGSGTVNTGAANRLAYYPSSGTTVDDLTAITANRALISDANGLPTHSATTATEVTYLIGVSSAIQTQLNGKQATGNYITDVTGDGSASGPGSSALTLATVNPNVGSFTNASITVNGKGLITAASNGTAGVTSVGATSPIASTGGTTPTISINNAAADGSTKGAASFSASDFDATTGNISIDYTNAQAASTSNKGLLTPTDWNTFNNKQAAGNYATQSGAETYGTTTGSANTYVLTLSPAITSYVAGQRFKVAFNAANTSASTININGLGAKAIAKGISSALVTGDLVLTRIYTITYDGTNFQLDLPGAAPTGTGNVVYNNTPTLTNPIVGTQTAGNNTTTAASTAFVQTAVGGYVPTTRTISTTAPLTGGGDLSANRTFAMAAATGSVDGYLAATNFNTFNGKIGGTAATDNVSFGSGTNTITSSSNLKYNGTYKSLVLGGATGSAWTSQGFIFDGGSNSIGYGTAGDFHLNSNAVGLGAWSYYGTGEAINHYMYQGAAVWRTAPSGTAGAAITWSEKMRLTNTGLFGIGTASPDSTVTVGGGFRVLGGIRAGLGLLPLDTTNNKIVTADATGKLSRMYWPSSGSSGGTNIYTSDGTLTGNRTLDGGGHDLSFQNIPNFNLQSDNISYSSTGFFDIFAAGGDSEIYAEASGISYKASGGYGHTFIGDLSQNDGSGNGWRLSTQALNNESGLYDQPGSHQIATYEPAALTYRYSGGEYKYDESAGQHDFTGGDVYIGGVLVIPSDKRYKKNVQSIVKPLDLLRKINPATYKYKQDVAGKKFDTLQHFGVIAQELETVIPDLVKTDAKGFKSVNYMELISVNLAATKELLAKVEKLEADNKKMKLKIKALSKRKK